MKRIFNYLVFLKIFQIPRFTYLADISGVFVSGLCFIHCWVFPVLASFLPGLIAGDEMVHPVFCSVAILSTMPILITKKFRNQGVLYQFAAVLGAVIMMVVLLAHDRLSFRGELLLNTMGGLSLVYVHCNNLNRKGDVAGLV